jgi:hypothetical protein
VIGIARTEHVERRSVIRIDNADVLLGYGANIGYAAKLLVEVVNELGASTVHVEATDFLSKPSVLVELIGPHVGIT